MTLEEKMNELAKQKMEEGKALGIIEGMKEGREEGIKEGIEKGTKEASIQIAKAMKEKGYDIKDIIELTSLTKEEIESL